MQQLDIWDGRGDFLADTLSSYLVNNSSLLPDWWSEKRDKELKRLSVEVDMLASVVMIITMKLFTLPLTVVPRNNLIVSHQILAQNYDALVKAFWYNYGEVFINDMLIYDKGAFIIIEDEINNFSEPITGLTTGLRYVNAEQMKINRGEESSKYPFIYLSGKGNYYIHKDRIIRMVQQPMSVATARNETDSAKTNPNFPEYNEPVIMGLSFISRALNAAQVLHYAIENQLESLGALESNEIIYGTSVNAKSLQEAFKTGERDSRNEGRARSGKKIFVGIRDAQGKLGKIPLNSLPNNFNYETFLKVTIKLLAISAGLDEDDIAPSSNAGTTKTATLISELKSRFKLVAWFSTKLSQLLENKFLPNVLMLQVGDNKQQLNESTAKALINQQRTEDLLLESGIVDVQQSRTNAVSNGAITEVQRVLMELEDGRLENGLPVRTLFFKKDASIQKLLAIPGIPDPLNLEDNNADEAIVSITNKIYEVETLAVNTTSSHIHLNAIKARAALIWLLEEYEEKVAGDDKLQLLDEDEQTIVTPTQVAETVEVDNIDDAEQPTEEVVVKEYADGKKVKKRPTSRKARKQYADLHKLAKRVWSGLVDEVTFQDVQAVLDDYGIDNEEKIKNTIKCINECSGRKLADVYTDLDDIVLFE